LLLFFSLAGVAAFAHASETVPWGVERVRANQVWDRNGDKTVDQDAIAGQNVRVAVIDWGVDYWKDGQGNIHYHSDLADNIAGGRGFRYVSDGNVEELSDYQDTWGHGTHVIGTVAAVDNDAGVIGAAPKVKIYALKPMTWNSWEIAKAINWSVPNGINIISMSFGTDINYPEIRRAVDYAHTSGVVLIAASGDTNENKILYPAKYDNVIAVSAVNQNNQRWVDPSTGLGSNYGPELDLVAPGADINSTLLGDTYGTWSGTSFAVPHVTAVAALTLASKINPKYDSNGDGIWQNVEVYDRLIDLAKDLGPSGRDDEYGYGLVDALLRDTAVDFATSYKTVHGWGYPLQIYVKVKNLGITAETLNVEAYVLNPSNQKVFDQWINGTQLLSGTSTTLTFTWTPQYPTKSIFRIFGHTPPPQEDIDTNNNINIYSVHQVNITVPGDINGSYKVDVYDAILISTHWSHSKSFESPGHVPEDWNHDINCDCTIDIYDSIILSTYYGADP